MNWSSPEEFLAMGGYGLYVWGSFFVTAACLIVESLLLRRRHITALAKLRGQGALNQERWYEKPS